MMNTDDDEYWMNVDEYINIDILQCNIDIQVTNYSCCIKSMLYRLHILIQKKKTFYPFGHLNDSFIYQLCK